MLRCSTCSKHTHPQCLGMGRNAVFCGTFLCPACTLQESNLHITSTKAHERARRLVMLEGSTLAVSSQDTYASALKRYTKCMAEVYMISEQEALPPGPKEQAPLTFVKLFMGWAAGHFKPATITTTVSALAEWHRSKRLELHTLNSRVVAQLSQAIRVYQGAKGVSSGKQGLWAPFEDELGLYCSVVMPSKQAP
eukprot:gene2271-biopygen5725